MPNDEEVIQEYLKEIEYSAKYILARVNDKLPYDVCELRDMAGELASLAETLEYVCKNYIREQNDKYEFSITT